jgi:hypothetical protein
MRIQNCCGFLAGILSAQIVLAGQSAGPGWGAPLPDHLTLFKLYMAANADVLDKDDQAAWEHHLLFKLPPSAQGSISPQCLELNRQLQNEITAQNLLNTARAEFKAALAQTKDWPRTAVFRITARASLNPYDAATSSFPVMGSVFMSAHDALKIPRNSGSQMGLPGVPVKDWCTAIRAGSFALPPHFALDITGNETIRSVPMSAGAAEAYLNSNPTRSIHFEAIVEVGPAMISPARSQHSIPIAARVIQARALDPRSGQTIHEYAIAGSATTQSATSPPATASPAANTPPAAAPASAAASSRPAASESASSAAGVVPLNSYRGFLLTVRDNPQIATPAALLPPTRMQVLAEQKMWATIQAVIDHATKAPQSDNYKLNPKRKTFIYEWQTEADASRTDLVDVFLRTDADWSFVTREPQWDKRFGAIVDAFLFSRKSVEGREASFAAQELVPVYKRHLDAAVAKAATKLYMTLAVPAAGYDFASKSIRFPQARTNVRQGLAAESGIELLESTDQPKFEGLVLPTSASSTANYHLFGAVQSMHRADPPSSNPGVNLNTVTPTQAWRSYFSIGSSGAGWGENIPYVEVLALDRQLRLASIPLDPARAEKIAKASHYATMGTITGLTAKLYFDADRVELSHRTVDGQKARYGVLFAKLQRIDVHGPDNELLTSFTPDSLPAPAARPTTTVPTAAKLPPEQKETLAERQAKINQDVTVKTNTILDDLKKKAEAQQAQAAAASQAASQAAQPPGAQGQPSGIAAGPAWQPCAGELKSGASQTVVPVEFVNSSKQPRKLYWFDFAGNRVLFGVLQPGQRAPMQTYTTHAWMIADGSDGCLGTLVISKAGSIEIR